MHTEWASEDDAREVGHWGLGYEEFGNSRLRAAGERIHRFILIRIESNVMQQLSVEDHILASFQVDAERIAYKGSRRLHKFQVFICSVLYGASTKAR